MTTFKQGSTLTIIYGGQFGSEGKGRIAAYIQEQNPHEAAVRIGGANAGHTFYMGDRKVVVQSIPVAAMMGAIGFIGPAGYILPDVLIDELKNGFGILGEPVKLIIDTNAAIILPEHMSNESGIVKRIGSTGEGVGACTAEKIMREPTVVIKYNSLLEDLLSDENGQRYDWAEGVQFQEFTGSALNRMLGADLSVMIEGTQGFGLSLHTGGFYPFCTSRECTPNALLSETGVGEHNADIVEKIMVLRTHPIRVAGNSGPLANETTWEALKEKTGGYVSIPEKTTVTKKVRRIAEFDDELVLRAIQQTGPTCLAVNFLDYLFPEAADVADPFALPVALFKYLRDLERRLGVPVKYISWGPTSQTADISKVMYELMLKLPNIFG